MEEKRASIGAKEASQARARAALALLAVREAKKRFVASESDGVCAKRRAEPTKI